MPANALNDLFHRLVAPKPPLAPKTLSQLKHATRAFLRMPLGRLTVQVAYRWRTPAMRAASQALLGWYMGEHIRMRLKQTSFTRHLLPPRPAGT